MAEDEGATPSAQHENARRILQESQIPSIWREMNRALLKGRGWVDEYDTGIILKWGTGYTRRHIWIDVDGETVRFRLRQHRRCDPKEIQAQCDGEWHSFNAEQWRNLDFMKEQMKYYYDHPVAEASDD